MKCLLGPISVGTFHFQLDEFCPYVEGTITRVLIDMSNCSVRCVNLAMGAGAQ